MILVKKHSVFSGSGSANPKEDWYKLTSEGLCLKAVKQEEKIKHGDYPNLLLQKWPAPEFICDTTLHFRD